ncbi:Response regulator receiver domain-containing protein [Desulfomicrobium apsheronum]|uniref:Response regulator receiver domain-containing protein n=1 Tax=Desulfomicrobium apsheronum TaxID=52560 RepID=A0A1I3VIE7_9BACT|nr:response regulator [Desulfomicrobium apsheronum]SFJ93911.1 Response regulator receiver domain-containing protein [Desulfomicrobium apsheronum]
MDMNTWNILLVDDEVDFIVTLAERLELRGVNPRVVHDGESALKAVADNVPQVIVLDVMMPGMKGIEVLQKVKSEHPDVQVILLTGQGKTRDGIEGMRHGAFAYLTKPLDLEELIRTINEAINPPEGIPHV